ncbi:hypothetical protein F5Y14DRAFT_302862 [Nemania sp. NC0429]|nr:hypothetical protein F5Y14DRAFT_302862 [Nemania sp. NC0429]
MRSIRQYPAKPTLVAQVCASPVPLRASCSGTSTLDRYPLQYVYVPPTVPAVEHRRLHFNQRWAPGGHCGRAKQREKSINQSINHLSVNQSVNQSINEQEVTTPGSFLSVLGTYPTLPTASPLPTATVESSRLPTSSTSSSTPSPSPSSSSSITSYSGHLPNPPPSWLHCMFCAHCIYILTDFPLSISSRRRHLHLGL